MLVHIYNKIKECEEIVFSNIESNSFLEKRKSGKYSLDELAKIYEEVESSSLSFKKTIPAMIMKINNDINVLKKLYNELDEYILSFTKVYLIESDNENFFDSFMSKKCAFFKHTDLAENIANFFVHSIRPGDCFTPEQMNILNDILDNVQEEIGVVSYLTPKVVLKSDCLQIIKNFNDLIDVIEHMIESQLYPSDDILEGHFLQALFNRKKYFNYVFENMDEEGLICVIQAKKVNSFLKNEYVRFFSKNVFEVKENEIENLVSILSDIGPDTCDKLKNKRKYIKRKKD